MYLYILVEKVMGGTGFSLLCNTSSNCEEGGNGGLVLIFVLLIVIVSFTVLVL